MLRISVIHDSDEAIQLGVEGWLVGAWVEELRQESNHALANAKRVTIDLSKVWFVDPMGVALLRDLATKNVAHLNCSSFISQQLEETVR